MDIRKFMKTRGEPPPLLEPPAEETVHPILEAEPEDHTILEHPVTLNQLTTKLTTKSFYKHCHAVILRKHLAF